MKQKGTIITLALTALLILAGSLVSVSGAAPASGFADVKVVSATWYAPDSSVQVSPNSSYVPLFVTIDDTYLGGTNYQNFSIDLGSSGFFSYSYVNGPNEPYADYQNLTFPASANSTSHTITLEQLINISSATPRGVYELYVNVTTNLTSGNLHIPFQVEVLATPQISLVNYFTNPPVIYQDEKYITLNAVFANTGEGPYENFNVSVSSQDFTTLTAPYHIPYFAPGSTQNITFLLDAHNVTGNSIITINYGKYSAEIGLYIHGHDSLGISSTLGTLQPGATKVVEEFNITNVGNVTMYDLEIHLLSPSVISIHVSSSDPLSALTADNVTIGELLPGQQATVTFLVDVSSSANIQSYPAQLVIQWYANNSQQQFFQVYNFAEKVTPTPVQQIQNSFKFTPLNIVILAVIVALVIALIVVASRGRSANREPGKSEKKQPPSLEHRELPEEKK